MPGRQHAVSNPMAARACRSWSPSSRAAAAAAAKLSSASSARPARCHAWPCRQRTSASVAGSGMPRPSASSSRAASSAKAKERSACAAASSAYATARSLPAIGAAIRKWKASSLTIRSRRPSGSASSASPTRRCRAAARKELSRLVHRSAQQLVPHAVHDARVPDLVEHPGVHGPPRVRPAAPRRRAPPPSAGWAARCRAGSPRSAAGARSARASGRRRDLPSLRGRSPGS